VSVVVDASLAATWFFEDESTPDTESVAEQVVSDGGLVPQLFSLEIANVFLLSERKGRLPAGHVDRYLDRLEQMELQVDLETAEQLRSTTIELARVERLTVHDATYLELALRKQLPLATLDRDLAMAARRRGITVIP
jgi:predicted nucleic acid-binding protein